MTYIQQGIEGVAPNKPHGKQNKPCLRPKLQDFIRHKLRMDYKDFAKLAGVTPATVTAWLYSPETPYPSLYKAQSMARTFGLTLEEILVLFEVAK